MHKQKPIKKISILRSVYSAAFVFTTGVAVAAYVNSSFLSTFMSTRYVGMVYALGALATLVILPRMAQKIARYGNRTAMLSVLTVNLTALFCFTFVSTPTLIILAFIVYMTTNSIISYCFDIFVEHYSVVSTVGASRGLYLTIINTAWLITPLLAAFILDRNGFSGIYGLAIGTTAIVLFTVYGRLSTFSDSEYKSLAIRKSLKFIKDYRPLLSVTIVNFILQFFYAWMVIYSPIYLHNIIGLTWDQIGIVFTVMLSAYVMFQYPVGRFADKHSSEKEVMTIGLAIASLATLAVFLFHGQSVIVWAAIFFCTRMGVSVVESTAEIHFFKVTRDSDASILGIYRNMTPLAYFVGALTGSFFLIFLPLSNLFLILAVVLFIGIHWSLRLENNSSLWSPSHIPSASTDTLPY